MHNLEALDIVAELANRWYHILRNLSKSHYLCMSMVEVRIEVFAYLSSVPPLAIPLGRFPYTWLSEIGTPIIRLNSNCYYCKSQPNSNSNFSENSKKYVDGWRPLWLLMWGSSGVWHSLLFLATVGKRKLHCDKSSCVLARSNIHIQCRVGNILFPLSMARWETVALLEMNVRKFRARDENIQIIVAR